MRRVGINVLAWIGPCVFFAVVVGAQGFQPDPVFDVRLKADRRPVVAAGDLRLALQVDIESGWHINTENPGDDFMVPSSVQWKVPEGWAQPKVLFPEGEEIRFDFSEVPLRVWEGRVVLVADTRVPDDAAGTVRLEVIFTAQACNNTQCLPPLPVTAVFEVEIAPAGSSWQAANEDLFTDKESAASDMGEISDDVGGEEGGLADRSLPLFLIGVFLAGLALNLTPCVFPLIPITVGFFAQQSKGRSGGSFWMALSYVMGLAFTYSVLGVVAALTGQLFGAALQSPVVVGLIVLVLVGLALSMFGLWELRTPAWAHRIGGARGGILGALLMGLVMGFVAAPCIGPFVLGLLTYVGQKGDPFFGFIAFFTLALGLGLPYLLLGTFTGAVNKLPMSGMWMVGVRRVFGVILIAMAAYFAAPLMPAASGQWLLAGTLVFGGLYLLVVDRTGNEQPSVDRVMRLLTAGMVVAGLWLSPIGEKAGARGESLVWQEFENAAVQAAISNGDDVIVDFYADWCAPCRELDEKTFADPKVAKVLDGYSRFKADQTRKDDTAQVLAADYGVRGFPTVIVYSNGKEKFRITGFERPERFLKRLGN
ncbi:MAG: thioredoxin fold domain-containing protein [Thermoanaerobaculales bacterium]|nr:thioredoxin fold domain-containing protein [Thermoanaerobaculales bacterium]